MAELVDGPLPSDGSALKRSNGRSYSGSGGGGGGGGGGGILDGIRRTFANLMRPQTASPGYRKSPDPPAHISRAAYLRQNATLPRKMGGTQSRVIIEQQQASPGHILVSERLVLPTADYTDAFPFPLTARSSHSATRPFTETPMPVRAELIKLDTLSGGSGQLLSRKDRKDHGHSFCAIPLEVDTFCDLCNQPIWGLGWGPVCQRCADCHMTCHWLCTDKVTVHCEASPPPVRPLCTAPSDSRESDREVTPPIVGDSADILTESSSKYKQINSPFMPEFSPPQKDIRLGSVSPIGQPHNRLSQARASSCDPGSPSSQSRSQEHAKNLANAPLVSASASSGAAFTAKNGEIRTFTSSPTFNASRRASDVGSPVLHRSGHLASDQPPSTLASSSLRPTSQCSLFASTDTNFSHLHETNRSLSAVVNGLNNPTSLDPSTNDRLDEVLENSEDEDSSSSTSVLMPASPPRPGVVTTEKNNEVGAASSEEPPPVPRTGKLRQPPAPSSSSRPPPLPTVATPAGLRRSPLCQSVLRYPARLDGGRAERRSVRRHASMLASFPYDISSLDHKDIAQRGIRVRQLSPKRDVGPTELGGVPVSDLTGSLSSRSNPSSASSSPTRESVNGAELVMSSFMAATQVAALSDQQMGLDGLHFSKVAIGPRDTLPWSPVELAERIDVFNANEFGLIAKMNPRLPSGDCEGQIRVHINLIRPVRMFLSSRPASIFDVVGEPPEDASGSSSDEDEAGLPTFDTPVPAIPQPPCASDSNVRLRKSRCQRVTSFRLPRGSSKLIHVRLSTPAQQVITSLLKRFSIDDNPQKFALYEHTIVSDQEVSVRKLFDNESPLGLFLRWTVGGRDSRGLDNQLDVRAERFNGLLAKKRLVLQENETGDIEWSCFSTAELQNFLQILNREEADYRRRIQLKYEIRGREIRRLMKLRAKSNPQRDPEETQPDTATTAAGNAPEAESVQDSSPKSNTSCTLA